MHAPLCKILILNGIKRLKFCKWVKYCGFFIIVFNMSVCVFMCILPLAQLLKNPNPTDPVSLLKSFTPLTFQSHWWVSPNNPPSHPNPTASHRQIVHHDPLHPSSDLHYLCCFSARISHHHHSRFCPLPVSSSCRSPPSFAPLHFICPATQTSAPSLFFFSFAPPLCPPQSQVSWRHKESRNTLRI